MLCRHHVMSCHVMASSIIIMNHSAMNLIVGALTCPCEVMTSSFSSWLIACLSSGSATGFSFGLLLPPCSENFFKTYSYKLAYGRPLFCTLSL